MGFKHKDNRSLQECFDEMMRISNDPKLSEEDKYFEILASVAPEGLNTPLCYKQIFKPEKKPKKTPKKKKPKDPNS